MRCGFYERSSVSPVEQQESVGQPQEPSLETSHYTGELARS